MDGTGKLFAEFVEAVAGIFETKTVQYPSDKCLSYAELVPFVRSTTPTSEPFVLVAESFSTPLAVQLAASHPPNLKGLIICAGFVTSPVRGLLRIVSSLLAPIVFIVAPSEATVRRFLVGPGASPSLLIAVRAAVSSVPPKVLSARLHAILSSDARTELGQVAVPILYIRAQQDRLVKLSSLEEIQRLRPDALSISIDAPHLLLQREPQRTAEIVSTFVRQLPE
jgi:pimeloyl-[acyl-carrier protein] methyl ester esterase